MRSITHSDPHGRITIPGSKSITQRLLAIAMINGGMTSILNPGYCDDVRAAADVVQRAGRTVVVKKSALEVRAGRSMPGGEYDFAESALALRMFTPVFAALDGAFTINGSAALAARNGKWFSEEMGSAGVYCSPASGLPMHVRSGGVRRIVRLKGGVTSQLVSGFLIAGMMDEAGVSVTVEKDVSKPYIELTMELIRRAGGRAWSPSEGHYSVKGGMFPRDCGFTVAGDWSNAAFWMVWAAINGEVTIEGLDRETGADRDVVRILRHCGATVTFSEHGVSVKKKRLDPFHFDASDSPDLVPPLTVLAAAIRGRSVISGVERLRYKETDRLKHLTEDFRLLGVDITHTDAIVINGGTVRGGVTLDSHGDHRLAMAYAIAGLVSQRGVALKNETLRSAG